MPSPSRRALLLGASALGLASSLGLEAQTSAPENRRASDRLASDLDQCHAFPFDKLPVRYSDAGAPTRDIAQGRVPTGELIEVHETTIEPGKMPHAAHQHAHEEFILVREGTLEFEYNGEKTLLGPGSVGYTAPHQMHGFRNAGQTPASYFVFSLGKK